MINTEYYFTTPLNNFLSVMTKNKENNDAINLLEMWLEIMNKNCPD